MYMHERQEESLDRTICHVYEMSYRKSMKRRIVNVLREEYQLMDCVRKAYPTYSTRGNQSAQSSRGAVALMKWPLTHPDSILQVIREKWSYWAISLLRRGSDGYFGHLSLPLHPFLDSGWRDDSTQLFSWSFLQYYLYA